MTLVQFWTSAFVKAAVRTITSTGTESERKIAEKGIN